MTQRGNRRERMFFEDEDYRAYLAPIAARRQREIDGARLSPIAPALFRARDRRAPERAKDESGKGRVKEKGYAHTNPIAARSPPRVRGHHHLSPRGGEERERRE
jgi:hypothetical protein